MAAECFSLATDLIVLEVPISSMVLENQHWCKIYSNISSMFEPVLADIAISFISWSYLYFYLIFFFYFSNYSKGSSCRSLLFLAISFNASNDETESKM
jgi:hypothetical protein